MNTSKILLLIALFLTTLGNAATDENEDERVGTKLTSLTHGLSSEEMKDPRVARYMDKLLPVPPAFETTPLGNLPIRDLLIFIETYSQLVLKGTPESTMVVPNYLLKIVPKHLHDAPLGKQVIITRSVADELAGHPLMRAAFLVISDLTTTQGG